MPAFVFQIADEFNHVQGINSQRIEGSIFGNLLGLDVEVVVKEGGNGVHDIHDENPFIVQVKREDIVPDYAVSTRESARS